MHLTTVDSAAYLKRQSQTVTTSAPVAALLIVLMSEAPLMLAMKVLPAALVGPIAQTSFFATYLIAISGLVIVSGWRVFASLTGVLLLAFAAWAGASIAWSIDPQETIESSLKLFGNLLACGYLASLGLRRLVITLAATGTALALGSALLGAFLPTIGTMHETHIGAWCGFWLEKNKFGLIMAVVGIVCVAVGAIPQHRRWAYATAVLVVVLVVLARSATALAGLAIGYAVVIGIQLMRRGPVFNALTLGAGVLIGVSVSAALLIRPDLFLELLGRDGTLTSRTAIWQSVSFHASGHPWLGAGFSAYFVNPTGPLGFTILELDFIPMTAHNSWLELFIEGGYPSVLIMILALAAGAFGALKRMYQEPVAAAVLAVLAAFVFMGMTESLLGIPNTFVWTVIAAFLLAVFVSEPPPSQTYVGIPEWSPNGYSVLDAIDLPD
jgi:exopolysaccharide production protein ExoQ